jgi:NADPH:quinone reductase-like Zn-dependent oxidoreductase
MLFAKLSIVHNESLCWLYTVVRHCHSVIGEPLVGVASPWARAIWSMGRALSVERGDALLHMLLDVDQESAVAAALSVDMVAGSEVAFRDGQKYLGHLNPVRDSTWPSSGNYALAFSTRGQIENLDFVQVPPVRADSDSIRVEVAYSALNLRDVLDVLGLYPGDAGVMGLEFSGTASGLRMFGLSGGHFGSTAYSNAVVTKRAFVATIPDSLSLRDAATMPFAFCNAMSAFDVCFGSKSLAGTTILITSMHICYGGIGVALAQLARKAGARRIFQIAGESSMKHIKSWGVDHVMPYGQLAYGEEILLLTGGQGVDSCVNSVIGLDYASRSIQVLAEEGKWLELGPLLTKTQVQSAVLFCLFFVFVCWVVIFAQDEFGQLRPLAQYASVSFDHHLHTNPSKMQSYLTSVSDDVKNGVLFPMPSVSFPIHNARLAFNMTFQVKLVAKLVFEHPWSMDEMSHSGLVAITGGV